LRISVFGLGYVGAVSCACLASLGHEVIGVDSVEDKVRRIGSGESPIVEPGIDHLLAQAVLDSNLRATTDAAAAVRASDLSLICVGTPSKTSGGIETKYLERVCRQIGSALRDQPREFFGVLNRSTSLPAVHGELVNILEESSGTKSGQGFGYVCHPEFLREGTAVDDFYHPPKIVFGTSDLRSRELCENLYPGVRAETFFVSRDVAAMVKYADNCFHALKVTFSNEMGLLCKEFGIDAHSLMELFCKDEKLNLSEKYLKPGNPFGGSCLPKDLRAVLDVGRSSAIELPMHTGMLASNRVQIDRLVSRIITAAGRQPVGVIGLAFKEGTDDIRESPMVAVVEQLLGKGIPLSIYDEHLSLAQMVGSNRSFALAAIPHLKDLLSNDLNAVVRGSNVLVVNHRLSPESWQRVQIDSGNRIFDLVNVPELRSVQNYEGLYW